VIHWALVCYVLNFFRFSFNNQTGPCTIRNAHLPDIATYEGVLGIFSLCNVVEMANITHHQTYCEGGLTVHERLEMINGRSVSRKLLRWLFRNYNLSGNTSIQTLYWQYFAYQARAICHGKSYAERRQAFSWNQRPIAAEVRKKVEDSFLRIPNFAAEWNSIDPDPVSFEWLGQEHPSVVIKEETEVGEDGKYLPTLVSFQKRCL
jgi:hypothetical protein